MSEREKTAGTVPVCTASTDRREVVVARNLGGRQVRTAFNFDAVLGSFSTQEDVYNASVRPLIEQVLNGFDATAFAYGQTGTGKTYTMEGDPEATDGAGLMPRAAAAVLQKLGDSKYLEQTVTMSYLEIYNEELSDLLAPPHMQQKLELMDTHRGVCCIGLSEVPVQTLADITELVKAAQEKKRMAETRMNARSSRSHCIFTMKVKCRKQVRDGELETVGKLHLVDLAGSECAKKAALGGDDASLLKGHGPAAGQAAEQERERRNINQSLLTLGRVIGALRENSGRVPYRDSKLTRLLKDALGGNCKTVLIATISPALAAVEETISTLTYAEQASGIQNKPVATSFLRMTFNKNGESRGELSGSSLSGCSTDWAEVEMKIMYLTQEVEEAQAALARKYVEMQELMDRVESAEQEADVAKAHVSEMRGVLSSSATAHTHSATSARALISELQAAARASAAAREEEASKLAKIRGERFIEEQIVALLQQQRQELHNDVVGVQKELEGAKTELVSTKDQMKGLQVAQEKRLKEAVQAIVKVTNAELEKVGQDFSAGLAEAQGAVDGVCSRLDSTCTSASAAVTRCAGAGQKVADAVTTAFNDLSSSYNTLHQQTCNARKTLEGAATTASEQLGEISKDAEAAATAATKAMGEDVANEESMKENNIPAAGKIIERKISSDSLGQGPQRTALKEVN
jgi:kinesin family protein 11